VRRGGPFGLPQSRNEFARRRPVPVILIRKPTCERSLLDSDAIKQTWQAREPTRETANTAKTDGDSEQQAQVTEIRRMPDRAVDTRGNQPMAWRRLHIRTELLPQSQPRRHADDDARQYQRNPDPTKGGKSRTDGGPVTDRCVQQREDKRAIEGECMPPIPPEWVQSVRPGLVKAKKLQKALTAQPQQKCSGPDQYNRIVNAERDFVLGHLHRRFVNFYVAQSVWANENGSVCKCQQALQRELLPR